MSTVLPPPPPPPQAPINPALLDSERYIDEHIGRTRRALKLADFAAGLITLVAGGLGFLLVAGLIDHWIVPGGLGAPGRLALFLVFVAGVAWHAWRRFVPLLRSINPVYAAHTIEQASPTLKNSLLNVLLFRTHRHGVPAKVYHAMEQQAAARLSAAPTDGAIDRAALLKLGYALLAIVAACAIYAVFSPKNLATSAGRILAPWADIAAPSRVQILNVQPGDATVARGERVAITAEVLSVRDDETVRLRYSTADEQLVDETIAMTRPAGGAKFTADLPRATDAGRIAGVTGDLEYWIEAGDAHSRRFNLEVFDRPTIVVQQVHYHAPAYTGEPSRTVENNGDVRGLEGTVVSIEALANQPIRSASIDFDADGTNDVPMKADGERATATFTLALRDDRRTPWHTNYVLRYTTAEGRGNVEPAQYSIEVTPDYAPEVSITRPEEAEHSARADEIVHISVEARDPDYAVQQVRLVGRVGERDVPLGELLTKNHTGRFTGGKPFVPGDAGLKAGDVLEYWAEARDNRRPEANLGMSEHRRLTVLGDDAAGGQQQQNNQGGGNRDPNEGQGPGAEGGNNANDGEAASAAGENQQGGESGEGESGEGAGQQSGAAGGESQDGSSDEAAEGQGAAGGQSEESAEQSGEGDEQRGGGAGGEDSGEQSDGENTEGGEAASAAGGAQQQGGDQGNQQQQGGEPAGNNPGGGSQGGQQERVASDGSDDATAMERIREHLANQDNAAGDQPGEAGEQQVDGGASPPDSESPQDGEAASAAGAEQQGAQPGQSGQQPQGANPDRTGAAGAPNNEQGAENPSAGELADGQPGEGEAPTDQGAPGPNGSQQRPGENPAAGEGAGETPAGADGALNENNDPSAEGDDAAGQPGAPGASTKRDREGANEGDEGESANEGDPGADDARGNDESNKRGDTGGDRAGAGQTGGGQQADNAGQGEAGSHTPSDTGGSESADQGAGETGTGAGAEQLAEGQTGQSSGDQAGAGSAGRDAEGSDSESGEAQDGEAASAAGSEQQGATGGQQSGAPSDPAESGGENANQSGDAASAAGGQSGGQSADGENDSEQQAEGADQPGGSSGSQAGGSENGQQTDPNPDQPQDENSSSGGAGQAPTRGGTGGSASEGTLEGAEPGGDAANLDFARQQTELVLDRLEEQVARQQVDPELLKRLGWSEDELRRFVTRWQGLKDRADAGGEDATDAQNELNAALRSLGLRREGPTRFRSSAKDDEERDLNDAYRARPPLEYMDWVRAYTKGLSASEDDDAADASEK